MYSGSAEFNNLIDKPGGNAPIKRFTFADFSIEQFTKLEYHGGSNNSDDIAIGTTNMAYLNVSALTDKIITNQEFLFEVGMELSDGTVEYAPMGYFTVQKPSGDEDTVDFTAYDRMQKFERPYSSSLTYPTDSTKVLNELCTICGVELATPITNPITIEDNLQGYTCREVLGYIAGIHGLFACFDRYGKLNLRWYSETPIEKQIGLIWSLTKSQLDYTVEKITLAKDTETTYTSGTGISGISHSNPYATQAIADSIYASLGGFTYRSCEISMLDDIRLDPWDMLKVTYLDGSVYKIPIMSLAHDFNACETQIKAFGKSDTENEYNYAGPITQAMERMSTELLVANRVIATKVDAEWVNAHTVTADKLEATNARVSTLEANSLTAETADLRYANITLANIDTANVDVANIGLLFTKVGLIDRATIVDGHITGFLDAVEVNADNITAGTLIADRILLKGSENGLLYALNNLGELTSTTVDTLDGNILTQRTITADKLVANSITANELDVENIFANKAVLNEIFAQNITATGSITGAKLYGTYAEINDGIIGGWSITSNQIYKDYTSGGLTYRAYLQAATSETSAIIAARITDASTGESSFPFYVRYNGFVHMESGAVGGFTIGQDYLRTSVDSRGYKFALNSNLIETNFCSYIGKEGTDFDYVYALHWDGSIETSGLTTANVTATRANIKINMVCENDAVIYFKDSNGTARNGISLTSANKYNIATGGIENTIQLGSTYTTINTICSSSSVRFTGASSEILAQITRPVAGTTSTVGVSALWVGNNTSAGNANNQRGTLRLYGTSSGYTVVTAGYASTSSITVTLPSSSGTLALTSSDKRLKENVKDAEVSGLDFINAIKLHQFDWKESGDHWNCGYIADELMAYDKHLVLEGSGGLNDDGTINPLCIDDFYLSAYQTKAIQELYIRIIELEEKIQTLKNAN